MAGYSAHSVCRLRPLLLACELRHFSSGCRGCHMLTPTLWREEDAFCESDKSEPLDGGQTPCHL